MKYRLLSIALLFALALGLAAPALAAERITHGTADTWITEDQLELTPPANYTPDAATQADAMLGAYNAYFLKDGIQTVSIQIGENNLNYLLQNADKEPYVMTQSVTIGDTTLGYCGLRTKGNYTLWHSYADNPGSDRFSFTVNFGKYITKATHGQKQNFYGVGKISFNNFFFDKSMLKEFMALELMEEMGLPTPRHGVAKLYINGEYYGVYAMIENLDTPILEQYWQVEKKDLSSYLCKPTGTNFLQSQIEEDPSPLYEYSEETLLDIGDMLPTAIEWVRRLNCLHSGTDFDGNPIDVNSEEYLSLLSQVLNTDEVVKYFAAHSWLCQMDNMFVCKQNFGLYLSPEGVATLVPWDYDLAFGCYAPSTAEYTANFPLDAMYQLEMKNRQNEPQASQRVYSLFPLFNVIYQNDALMEQYHSYMADCSRVAALGGTVASIGKTYRPGHLNAMIDTLKDALLEAAGEKLADNVYYMNWIQQPADLRKAIPNLRSIIAQRAVGVYTQVKGMDTWVCASGCNLETLGNALRADNSTYGNLTVVDPDNGIFASAQFEGSHRSLVPSLNALALEKDNPAYQKAAAALPKTHGQTLLVYSAKVTGKPASDFTVTLPLPAAYAGEESQYTVYTGAQLTAVEATREDNLLTFTAKDISTIAVLITTPAPNWLTPAAVILVTALALTAALLILRKRRNQP